MADFYSDRVVVAGEGAVNLIGWLGVMGMVLSMVGLYGLVAYSVNRRTREIGIRMAVGATPGSVMRVVLWQGAKLAIVGAIAGLIASVGSRRGLGAVFPFAGQIGYGSYWLVAIALVAITLLAAYIPARRASQVDPTVALRHD
jgi:putative ABC transport system permease protein